jgi:uncharacterized membrane protein
VSEGERVLLLLHILASFWYVIGLATVQLSYLRGWQSEDAGVQATSLDEAAHYQGVFLLPGAIALGFTGLFFWSQMGYNLLGTGWLLLLEVLYVLTLLVCLPLLGLGLRRARLAALKARRTGQRTAELEQALGDGVPLVFGGIATIQVPVMAYLSVFRPF